MILFVFLTGVLLLNLASVKGESEPQDDAVMTTQDYPEPPEDDSNPINKTSEDSGGAVTPAPDYSEPEDGDGAVTVAPDYSELTTPDYDYNATFDYDFPMKGESEPQNDAVTPAPDYPEPPEDDDSAVTAAPDYSDWTTPDYDYNVTFEYEYYTEKPLEVDSAHELQEVSRPTGGSPQTYSITKTSGIGLLTASVLLGLAVQQIL